MIESIYSLNYTGNFTVHSFGSSLIVDKFKLAALGHLLISSSVV